MTESASTLRPLEGPSNFGAIRTAERGETRLLARWVFPVLLFTAVALRILIVALPGDEIRTPWGGGGDSSAYVLLAQNLASGRGYAYAGWPTAYRAPIYPLLLAALMKMFGTHALLVVRVLQFCAGLLVAYLCGELAGKIWGRRAKNPAILVALFCPTLFFMTGEILSETVATLFTMLFLYLLVSYWKQPSWTALCGAAFVAGVSTLARFNMVLFVAVLLVAVLARKTKFSTAGSAAVAILLPALVLSPWLIRNFVVFHGGLTLSTEGGPTAAMGILAPQGRALSGDSQRLKAALGWLPPSDIETNDLSRNALPSEAVLNRRAWLVTFGLWKRAGWKLAPLTVKKLSYFWLSTDQLFSMGSFSSAVRFARAGGVIVYWVILALAFRGWWQLRESDTTLASLILFYCLAVTILHTPFNMNTRLRIPLIDPLLPVLASAAMVVLFDAHFSRQNRAIPVAPGRQQNAEAREMMAS